MCLQEGPCASPRSVHGNGTAPCVAALGTATVVASPIDAVHAVLLPHAVNLVPDVGTDTLHVHTKFGALLSVL